MADRERKGLSTVFISNDDAPWMVAETPLEVVEKVKEAERNNETFVEFTLGNPNSDWNGRPVFLRAKEIHSIGPPRSYRDDEEEED